MNPPKCRYRVTLTQRNGDQDHSPWLNIRKNDLGMALGWLRSNDDRPSSVMITAEEQQPEPHEYQFRTIAN